MTYPGDSKLSEELRERVENTFKQSRELAKQGKTQEALLGCEFVLRLDTLYQPARDLVTKIEAGEEVAADDVGGPNFVEGLETFGAEGVAAQNPALDLGAEFSDLLERRDYRTLLRLAEEHKDALAADPALAATAQAASERLEAEPYVRSFIEAAELARREGRDEDAEADLAKARALDPSHPSLPSAPLEPVLDDRNDRIGELLAEGQRALDSGDHQGAIDSWSRIFLIDIDQAEANRRIEAARKLKAEGERQIEEAFHEGVALWELGTTDKAREQFEKVIAIDPSHPAANDYLQRMDARAASEVPSASVEGGGASGDVKIMAPPMETVQSPAPTAADFDIDIDDLSPDAPASKPAARAKLGTGLLANRRFVTLAGAGILILLAIFAALYLKRDSFFPNSDPAPAAAEMDVLARARKLQAGGRLTMAKAQLNQLPTDHPQYAEAMALIAQWDSPPAEQEPSGPSGPSEEQLLEQDVLVAAAEQAREQNEYLRAANNYLAAAQITDLSAEDLLLQAEVEQRLAGLESEIQLFRQGDWEFVLPGLWKLHSANPEDRDVVRLMVDSYYNLGVRDLQRGDPPAASEKLERALELDEDDAGVDRLLRFSEVYDKRQADLLYSIFVKYLPFR